jgi:hypothetical protein
MVSIALTVLLIGFGACLVALLSAARRAPDGYEDRLGFHYGQPVRADSMILAVTASMDGYDHGAEIPAGESILLKAGFPR